MRSVLATWTGLAVVLGACSRPAPPAPQQPDKQLTVAPAAEAESERPLTRGLPVAPTLTWIEAPPQGDVTRSVRAQLKRAKAANQVLLVYVGATWCEPCQVFHDAAQAGRLNDRLGRLRILAFDLDRDRDRLAAAGYQSQMIPLFAVPNEDGSASGIQHGGAVKGPEAIGFLLPKLEALMGSAARARPLAGGVAPAATATATGPR